MPLCCYHVRMFTNEAWRHNLLCNILFTGGPITRKLISRMTYISCIYFAHLFCAPKFLNDRWEQCVLLVFQRLWVNRAELLWSTAKFLSFDFIEKNTFWNRVSGQVMRMTTWITVNSLLTDTSIRRHLVWPRSFLSHFIIAKLSIRRTRP